MKHANKVLVSMLRPAKPGAVRSLKNLTIRVIEITEKKPDLDPVLEMKLGVHKHFSISIAYGRKKLGEEMVKKIHGFLEKIFEEKSWSDLLGRIVEQMKIMRSAKMNEGEIAKRVRVMLREGILLRTYLC